MTGEQDDRKSGVVLQPFCHRTECFASVGVDTSEDVYSSIANSVKTYVFKGYLIFYKNGGVSMFKIGDMGESRIGFINENTILRIEDLNYECNTNAVMIKSNKLTIRHEIIEKSFDVINTNIKKISMNIHR